MLGQVSRAGVSLPSHDAAFRIDRLGQHQLRRRDRSRACELVEGDLLQGLGLRTGQSQFVGRTLVLSERARIASGHAAEDDEGFEL